MIANVGTHLRLPAFLAGVLAACLLPCVTVLAQEGDGAYRSAENSRIEREQAQEGDGAYRSAENRRIEQEATQDRNFTPSDPAADLPPADSQNTGPVRLARFAHVSGNVTWRPDGSSEWSRATVNLPIREGSEIWVTEGGHADVQFDDGSELRLGNNALAILKTLYSDKDGEFTQISLNGGLATLHTRHDDSVFQVDTPAASVKSAGASQIRFGVDTGAEVTVQQGDAAVESPQGSVKLHVGDYLYLADSNAPFNVRPAPARDSWDRWNDERNRILEGRPERHVPSNIGLVSGELDDYGTWRNDPANGWVWCPRGVTSDWRPYYDGHWTWIDPFGWTWVSNEPWGWAPYHYGTWVHLSYGWGWCPGPLHQYWSPAVVSFSTYNGCVAWAPLCPWEVHYPSALSFGFWGRNWAFSFSIGCAGVYYPSGGYCIGRPWNSFYVNHFDRFRDHNFRRGSGSPSFDRFARTNEFAAANSHFVPFNGSRVSGATFARTEAFGGHGRYEPLSKANASYFTRGRNSGLPVAGRTPVAGPPGVAPTAVGRTPTRSFATGSLPSQSMLQRNVYHAPTSGLAGRGARGGSAGLAGRDSRTGIGAGAVGRDTRTGSAAGVSGRDPRTSGTISGSGRDPRIGAGAGTAGRDSRVGVGGGLPGRDTRTGVPAGGINRDTRSGVNVPAPSTSRIGIEDGRVPRQPVRPGDTGSAAEAARRARSSLGMGAGRQPAPYGGARSDAGVGDRGGRTSGGNLGDRSGRTPSYGGGTGSGAPNGSGSRNPRTGGSSERSYGQGLPGSAGGRTPDSSNRPAPRSYGTPTPGSGSGSGSRYGGDPGSYRTYGGRDYGTGSPGSRYGGSDPSSGRSRSYGGDYGSGRSNGGGSYGGGRSGGSYGGRSDSGSSGRSGGNGGRSESGSSGRSGGGSGGNSGRSGDGDGGRSGGGGGGYSSGRGRSGR